MNEEVCKAKKNIEKCVSKRFEIAKKGVKSLILRNFQKKTYANHIYWCSIYVGGVCGVKKKISEVWKKVWNQNFTISRGLLPRVALILNDMFMGIFRSNLQKIMKEGSNFKGLKKQHDFSNITKISIQFGSLFCY